ncbi:MAG: DUF2971 domain-containing protein [Rikenellaceae bacterium]
MEDEQEGSVDNLDLESAYVLAKVNFDCANYKNALSCINRAITLAPKTGFLYFDRAIINVKLNMPQQVFDDLRQSKQVEPFDANSAVNAAVMYMEYGEFKLALDEFDDIENRKPEEVQKPNFYILRARALCLFMNKQKQEGVYGTDTSPELSEANKICERIFDDITLALELDSDYKYFSLWNVIENQCESCNCWSDTNIKDTLRRIFICVYAIRMLHLPVDKMLVHYTKMGTLTSIFKAHQPPINFAPVSFSGNLLASFNLAQDNQHRRENESVNKLIFRAYNACYMNDPEEGNILCGVLAKHLVNNTDIDAFNKYWESLFSTANDLRESDTYLLCCSGDSLSDKLPMWSLYGGNGTGCCFSFSKEALLAAIRMSEQEISGDDSSQLDSSDNKYPNLSGIYNSKNSPELLSVFYPSKGKQAYIGRYFYEKLACLMLSVISNNKDELQNLRDLKQEADSSDGDEKMFRLKSRKTQKKKINNLVQMMIDQIRFLYKDSSYEHEKERRLVRFSDKKDGRVKLDEPKTNGDIPRLYVDIETNIDYADVSVTLGPKVENPQAVAAYLKFVGVGDVRKSIIQFR